MKAFDYTAQIQIEICHRKLKINKLEAEMTLAVCGSPVVCCCFCAHRYRKMKERLGMTDMRKAANRMNFGEVSKT